MKPRKMQTSGHYRRPRVMTLPGQYNKPRVGRVGKLFPSFKKLGMRRGR